MACDETNDLAILNQLKSAPSLLKSVKSFANFAAAKNNFRMSFKIKHNTMGEVKVPADKYWGAQTERSRNNFKIGPEASMPKEIIYAFGYLKKAAAMANHELGVLTADKKDLIAKACD